ncbi:jg1259, partial [Pararge aegeria aegeria]
MAEEQLHSKIQDLQRQLMELQSLPQTGTVNGITVKLPTFWREKPVIWFAQAEAQFEIAGIKQDSTKYGYVLSMLDERMAEDVEDIIESPPADNKYDHLKRELIARFSVSKEQRVRELLNNVQLGDRKPSAFLRHLRSLAGSSNNDEGIIRELWMRRLPQEVQRILMAQRDLPLDKVAEIADTIVEAPAS